MEDGPVQPGGPLRPEHLADDLDGRRVSLLSVASSGWRCRNWPLPVQQSLEVAVAGHLRGQPGRWSR